MGMSRDLQMRRCFDLARLGHQSNRTNPCVGALLSRGRHVRAEGFYQKFGGPHAEVDCLSSLRQEDTHPDDELFVSLEPCNVDAKTPPCRDLILSRQIRNLTVSIVDPNPQISGSSIEELSQQGVTCRSGLLERLGETLLRPFHTSITQERPYLVLKWAQSRDGFIGRQGARIKISNGITDRLVHKWRAASDGIMVGTQTALVDNPRLDNRLYYGPSPTRIILDRKSKIPLTHHVLNDGHTTIICGPQRRDKDFVRTSFLPYGKEDDLSGLLAQLYKLDHGQILVEGGAELLRFCLTNGLWDECRIIVSDRSIHHGIPAPKIDLQEAGSWQYGDNQVLQLLNKR